jgi:hypothetical protein
MNDKWMVFTLLEITAGLSLELGCMQCMALNALTS